MIYSKRHKVSIAKMAMSTIHPPTPAEPSSINYGIVAQGVTTVLADLLSTQATVGWNLGPNILSLIKSSSYVRVPDNDRSC